MNLKIFINILLIYSAKSHNKSHLLRHKSANKKKRDSPLFFFKRLRIPRTVSVRCLYYIVMGVIAAAAILCFRFATEHKRFAVNALVDRGILLMRAYFYSVERAVIACVGMICTLTYSAVNRAVRLFILFHCSVPSNIKY